MNAAPAPLFRREVLEARSKRLHGEVSLAVPISWQIVGFTLLGSLVAAIIFLSSASYSRVETVSGRIVTHKSVGSMPDNATPGVELYVPASAVGHLAVGQEVHVGVDAFPYHRFGTIVTRIRQIFPVPVPKATADGGTVPVYLVTAELPSPWISAFGRRQPLLAGMRLSARIVTRTQSLFQWLFDPLAATDNR